MLNPISLSFKKRLLFNMKVIGSFVYLKLHNGLLFGERVLRLKRHDIRIEPKCYKLGCLTQLYVMLLW